MSMRPPLTNHLPPSLFAEYYWLRSELCDFCRECGLPTSGSKPELASRIHAYLSGSPIPLAKPARQRASMPSHFSRETVIADGWSCSQSLREFLSSELHRPFRFDGRMRSLIHDGSGKTLGGVIDEWLAPRQVPNEPIASQFEYNRFVRAYRKGKGALEHCEVVAAWHKHRSLPVSQRPAI